LVGGDVVGVLVGLGRRADGDGHGGGVAERVALLGLVGEGDLVVEVGLGHVGERAVVVEGQVAVAGRVLDYRRQGVAAVGRGVIVQHAVGHGHRQGGVAGDLVVLVVLGHGHRADADGHLDGVFAVAVLVVGLVGELVLADIAVHGDV